MQISFAKNMQFVSDNNLSHRFLRQHGAVAYKNDWPKGVRENGLSRVLDVDEKNAPNNNAGG